MGPPPVGPDAGQLAARRDLNNGFGDALAKAFELAATPALFGLFGWLLDRGLGTAPLLLVAFIVIVFVYEVWKLFLHYGAAMDAQEAKLLGRRPIAAPPANSRRIHHTSVSNASRVRRFGRPGANRTEAP